MSKETLKHAFMQVTTCLLMIIVLGLISLQFLEFILPRATQFLLKLKGILQRAIP